MGGMNGEGRLGNFGMRGLGTLGVGGRSRGFGGP
jgi:hypothetical protein